MDFTRIAKLKSGLKTKDARLLLLRMLDAIRLGACFTTVYIHHQHITIAEEHVGTNETGHQAGTLAERKKTRVLLTILNRGQLPFQLADRICRAYVWHAAIVHLVIGGGRKKSL